MTTETDKFDLKYGILDTTGHKTLPNFFEDKNGDFWKYILASAVLHPLIVFIIWLLFFEAMLLFGIRNPLLKRPEAKKDIEFVLTQNEQTPIDKNTKYRSDKNSRAGGKHDPNKAVSMPSPSPAPAPVQKPAPKQAEPIQKPSPKPVAKPVSKPEPQKPVSKPQPAPKPSIAPPRPSAPVQRPVLKPSASVPRPQIPKIANAPASPFKIDVPKTSAPVGKGFSASGGTASSGGYKSSGAGSSSGSGMPAPQFSTTRTSGASSASRGGSGTGRGGYGTGNMGNPGPGNPAGAPGIDAIKSPQWGPYMRDLESKIKRNWHPPKGNQSKRVVLFFKIGRRGELLSVRISKTSGSQANDQAAISAVQMSAPFRALPPEFKGSSVEIEFTFDYNVLGASYR